MTLRHIGFLLLSVFIGIPSIFALDSGKAEGTVTINRKPVKLKYAFAKKEKDFDEKDRWVVVLTDRVVSRSVLGDEQRLKKAVENGEVVAAVLKFDEAKALEQVEVRSKALQHKSMPLGGTNFKLTGVAFSADAIEGSAATIEDQEFFSDVAAMSAKFRAPLGKDGKFGESAAATAELAASRPKIADGGASGTLKLDGATIKLMHSIARTKPNSFDEKKTDVVVLLTNEPVTAEMLLDERKMFAAVESGTLRGLKVTIDSDEKPYHLQMLDPKASFQLSGSGFWNFDAYDFSDQHVTAKFYTTEMQEFMDKHKYSYDVTFAVPVLAIKAPEELTIDASTGTKLPSGGGDAGKAYIAFDKASRAGNFNEMKKYASKTREMPDVSPAELKEMVEMMKAMRPAKVKVTGGFVAGDHATLSVDAEDPESKTKMRGTIEMAREDGGWKVLGETWRQ
ncbi:MAG: hypothetical protein JJE51_13990 [Thermoanaerobaculia bacterium]|nr:hypothetical protein [Thermoanaerobaculia bacterium]